MVIFMSVFQMLLQRKTKCATGWKLTTQLEANPVNGTPQTKTMAGVTWGEKLT